MAISTVQVNGTTLMTVNDTTATASDVIDRYFYAADGTRTLGTGTPGIADAPEKAVNFYDYDGVRLYSYTAAEAQELTELPANPSHTGLTAQGWNWTLQQIKTQLTNVGGDVNVGQMYVTTSGKTEFDILLDDPDYLSPYLGLAVNGTVTVDWGDGSNTETLTGTSDTSNTTAGHTYSSVGSYTITVTVDSGKFTIHNSSFPGVLHTTSYNSSNSWYSSAYSRAITAVRLGSNVYIGNYAFHTCASLISITMPSAITSFGQYVFSRCYRLRFLTVPSDVTVLDAAFIMQSGLEGVSIPYGITTINASVFASCMGLRSISSPALLTTMGSSAFNNCGSLRQFKIPSGITAIPTQAFYYCYCMTEIEIPDDVETIGADAFRAMYSITSITIPSKVTSIGTAAFRYAYCLSELHFKPTNPPTLGDSYVFGNLQTTCTIYVPTGSLSAYTSAQYYPSSSSYTYVEE